MKDGLGNNLSYSQLISRVSGIATSLSDAHITEGSKVGVFQEPSTDWICSLLAIMRIGAVYVPLDPRSTTLRLATIVEGCRPAAILIDSSTQKQVSELNSTAKIVNMANVRSTSRTVPNLSKGESTMTVLYTSGSTGTPKGESIFTHHMQCLTSNRY